MPYRIEKRESQWCVVKEAQGRSPQETIHCHNTKRDAEGQATALRIAEQARK